MNPLRQSEVVNFLFLFLQQYTHRPIWILPAVSNTLEKIIQAFKRTKRHTRRYAFFQTPLLSLLNFLCPVHNVIYCNAQSPIHARCIPRLNLPTQKNWLTIIKMFYLIKIVDPVCYNDVTSPHRIWNHVYLWDRCDERLAPWIRCTFQLPRPRMCLHRDCRSGHRRHLAETKKKTFFLFPILHTPLQ